MKHIIKTQTFSVKFLNDIFNSSSIMRECVSKNTIPKTLKDKIIATIFYEESTRTRLSFEAAALRLGAGIISSANARQFSSVSKGETLEDTIKVVSSYVDVIVLRHHQDDGAIRAANVSSCPIINGGSGANGQHPTQSLLDLFTIYDEFGQIDGLNIALSGDLKHGRTVHSLAYLFGKFNNVMVYFVSPENLQMPKNITDYLNRHNVSWNISSNLEDIIEDIDVLYQTRIQKERFESEEEYEKSKGNLCVTRDLANSMKTDSIILHPLPRVSEISQNVDDNYRAKYFKQAKNGLYVRMALLDYLIGV